MTTIKCRKCGKVYPFNEKICPDWHLYCVDYVYNIKNKKYKKKIDTTKERLSFRKKFIGDRRFYMMVLAVAVPIMIQNGITNFVSLLYNIFFFLIGTDQI